MKNLEPWVWYIHIISYNNNKSTLPWFLILPDETHESVNLGGGDVFLQQLPVVMQQRSNCVLRQYVIADLLLHERELLRYPFLVQIHKKQLIFIIFLIFCSAAVLCELQYIRVRVLTCIFFQYQQVFYFREFEYIRVRAFSTLQW